MNEHNEKMKLVNILIDAAESFNKLEISRASGYGVTITKTSTMEILNEHQEEEELLQTISILNSICSKLSKFGYGGCDKKNILSKIDEVLKDLEEAETKLDNIKAVL